MCDYSLQNVKSRPARVGRPTHDALEFPDGQVALLTDLFEGQEATVLQLPAQPVTAAEIRAQERVPHI